MMGAKLRVFTPLTDVSLESLVPAITSIVISNRPSISPLSAISSDRAMRPWSPSIDPVVFFKLQLVMFFEGIRSERQLMAVVADRLSPALVSRLRPR